MHYTVARLAYEKAVKNQKEAEETLRFYSLKRHHAFQDYYKAALKSNLCVLCDPPRSLDKCRGHAAIA